jgi:hypothetical protein
MQPIIVPAQHQQDAGRFFAHARDFGSEKLLLASFLKFVLRRFFNVFRKWQRTGDRFAPRAKIGFFPCLSLRDFMVLFASLWIF